LEDGKILPPKTRVTIKLDDVDSGSLFFVLRRKRNNLHVVFRGEIFEWSCYQPVNYSQKRWNLLGYGQKDLF
jgi:hypothetical protein